MPITSAARRASLASSSVQQPRAPVRYELGLRDKARCTPVTSWPASAALAAATAESTPPDMAARMRRVVIVFRIGGSAGGPAGPLHDLDDDRTERVYVGLLGRVAKRETQRRPGPRVVGAHSQQHVTRLGNACGAGGAGRAGNPPRVEQHQQRVTLAAREGEMRVA